MLSYRVRRLIVMYHYVACHCQGESRAMWRLVSSPPEVSAKQWLILTQWSACAASPVDLPPILHEIQRRLNAQ